MLKRHLILAKRLFFKYPLNTFITLSGLSLGLAGFLVLALYVFDEYETDRFHSNYENIYQVNMTHYLNDKPIFTFPPPAGFKNDLDQMQGILSNTRAFTAGEAVVEVGDKKFYERKGIFIDSAWLEVFDFSYLNNSFDFVTDPGKIAISKQLVEKYFNDSDPIGQTMVVNGEEYLVENIILPPKHNSSLNPSFLISYNKQKQLGVDLNAYNNGPAPYWIVASNTSSAALEQKLQPIITEKVGEMEKVHVIPLRDYYFTADTYYGNPNGSIRGNKKFYNVFITVALILLLLAVIN